MLSPDALLLIGQTRHAELLEDARKSSLMKDLKRTARTWILGFVRKQRMEAAWTPGRAA